MKQVKEQNTLAPHVMLPNVIKHNVLPDNTVIASQDVEESIRRLSELKRQEATLLKLIKIERAIIDPFMGDATELLDIHGNELATWRYDSDREELDKKALKLNFADVYYACTTVVKGVRKLVLKV